MKGGFEEKRLKKVVSKAKIQNKILKLSLIKETKHFPTNILSPSFLVIHDARRCCKHNISKLQFLLQSHQHKEQNKKEGITQHREANTN